MFAQTSNEPLHDKTIKMSVCPAKTQIDLSIQPDQTEPSLHYTDKNNSDQIELIATVIVFSCHGLNAISKFVMWIINIICISNMRLAI